MRRFVAISSLLVLAACGNASLTGGPSFSDDTYGVTMDVSAADDWEQQAFPGALVVFLSPAEGETDEFRENITVVVEEGVEGYTAEQYRDAAKELMERSMTGFEEEATGTMQIDGTDVPTRDYVFTQGEVTVKGRQAYVVRDNNAFVLTFSAQPDSFDTWVGDAEEIMGTFRME